jgi:hypothetical protein
VTLIEAHRPRGKDEGEGLPGRMILGVTPSAQSSLPPSTESSQRALRIAGWLGSVLPKNADA